MDRRNFLRKLGLISVAPLAALPFISEKKDEIEFPVKVDKHMPLLPKNHYWRIENDETYTPYFDGNVLIFIDGGRKKKIYRYKDGPITAIKYSKASVKMLNGIS